MYEENLNLVDELAKYLDEIVKNYGFIKKFKKEKNQMVPNEIRKLLSIAQKKKDAKVPKNDEKLKTILDKIYKLIPKEETSEQIEDIKFWRKKICNLFLNWIKPHLKT